MFLPRYAMHQRGLLCLSGCLYVTFVYRPIVLKRVNNNLKLFIG